MFRPSRTGCFGFFKRKKLVPMASSDTLKESLIRLGFDEEDVQAVCATPDFSRFNQKSYTELEEEVQFFFLKSDFL